MTKKFNTHPLAIYPIKFASTVGDSDGSEQKKELLQLQPFKISSCQFGGVVTHVNQRAFPPPRAVDGHKPSRDFRVQI